MIRTWAAGRSGRGEGQIAKAWEGSRNPWGTEVELTKKEFVLVLQRADEENQSGAH